MTRVILNPASKHVASLYNKYTIFWQVFLGILRSPKDLMRFLTEPQTQSQESGSLPYNSINTLPHQVRHKLTSPSSFLIKDYGMQTLDIHTDLYSGGKKKTFHRNPQLYKKLQQRIKWNMVEYQPLDTYQDLNSTKTHWNPYLHVLSKTSEQWQAQYSVSFNQQLTTSSWGLSLLNSDHPSSVNVKDWYGN